MFTPTHTGACFDLKYLAFTHKGLEFLEIGDSKWPLFFCSVITGSNLHFLEN